MMSPSPQPPGRRDRPWSLPRAHPLEPDVIAGLQVVVALGKECGPRNPGFFANRSERPADQALRLEAAG